MGPDKLDRKGINQDRFRPMMVNFFLMRNLWVYLSILVSFVGCRVHLLVVGSDVVFLVELIGGLGAPLSGLCGSFWGLRCVSSAYHPLCRPLMVFLGVKY